MKAVVFSALAVADIERVAAYSATHWPELGGEYFDALQQVCMQLPTMHPVLAQRVPRHPLLRRVRWEDHFIIYRETDVEIEVVRILHTKMDPKRHL
jgi:plasmid stabilization system protein ParE